MPSYTIKLTPIKPNGCKRVTLKVRAATREDAQRAALKSMPSCRLHDDEPSLPVNE